MKIGITMGDPAGIGPELVLKTLARLPRRADILVFANRKILARTAQTLKIKAAFDRVKHQIIDCPGSGTFDYGRPTRATARAAMAAIDRALAAEVDVLVTMPIVKDAVRQSLPGFTGHTEYLAGYFGVKKFAMMGIAGEKRIVVLTTHLPLRRAIAQVRREKVSDKISLLVDGLRNYFGIARPRIAVAAVNPHVFEFSLGEDEEVLAAVIRARARGVDVHGPYAADSLFGRKFDGYLAMYHDQAFVYLKAQKRGLNFTLGLPIIRLAPLYGAGLDIAGQGRADFSGVTAALIRGRNLYENKRRAGGCAAVR